MFWLDLAVASRRDAERAYFEFEDGTDEDEITRARLEDVSEFELAHLGMLLTDGFNPELVLDGDAPEDIVTACDPALVRALAGLGDSDAPDLARRWENASGLASGDAALDTLRDLAREASHRALPLLYAQGSDRGDTIAGD